MKTVILFLIRFYQKYLSFDTGWIRYVFPIPRLPQLRSGQGRSGSALCRFTPTCSEYMYQAVDGYGIIHGLWLGMKRILRCHPWSRGGEDPVPTTNDQ